MAGRNLEGKGVTNQFKGKARELWGRLSGRESDVARGKGEQMGGKVQEHLGRAASELGLDGREHRH